MHEEKNREIFFLLLYLSLMFYSLRSVNWHLNFLNMAKAIWEQLKVACWLDSLVRREIRKRAKLYKMSAICENLSTPCSSRLFIRTASLHTVTCGMEEKIKTFREKKCDLYSLYGFFPSLVFAYMWTAFHLLWYVNGNKKRFVM